MILSKGSLILLRNILNNCFLTSDVCLNTYINIRKISSIIYLKILFNFDVHYKFFEI